MEKNELEEGEACSGQEEKKDDSSIDPDIAFSYIDEKLQDVLGHIRIDFEGSLSAENLGPKFGGYGSFLPTYQRSPSILAQPKSPPRAPNPNVIRSPYVPSFEGTRQNSSIGMGPLELKNNNISAPSMDNSTKKGIGAVNDEKPNSLNKPAKGGGQQMLKFCIKVGPENIVPRNNAAIYSGLGLDMSPSSSLEGSPDGSGGLPTEFQDVPDESPRTILQMMTCVSIPGGFFLSPLRDSLFQLTKEDSSFVKKCTTGIPDKYAILGDSKLSVKDKEGCNENKRKPDDKKGRSMEVKNRKYKDGINTVLNRKIDIETQPGQELVSNALNIPLLSGSKNTDKKAESRVVGESVKGVTRMFGCSKESEKTTVERIQSPDLVKHEQWESNGIIENYGAGNLGNEVTHSKEKFNSKAIMIEKSLEERNTSNHKVAPSVLQREDMSKVGENYGLGDADFNRIKGRKEQIAGPVAHMDQISSRKANSCEEVGKKVFQGKDHLFEGKRKLGSQTDAAPFMELSKDNLSGQSFALLKEKKRKCHTKTNHSEKKPKVLKPHKQLSRGSLKKSCGDVMGDANVKQLENRTDLLDLHYKGNTKFLKPEHEEPFQHIKTSNERSRGKKINNPPISDVTVNEPTVMPLMGSVPTSGAAAAPHAPVVIEEHWVCCDACQKWRLLPYGTNPDHLPKSWQCEMLNWLPGMNTCEIGEEETTKALNALYLVPAAAECGARLEGHHNVGASGIATTNALHLNQKLEQNLKSVPPIRKKKNGPKDASYVSNHSIQLSNPVKGNQQATMKSRSLNDGSPYPFETNSLDKLGRGHARKSTDFTAEKQKHKQKENRTLGCYSNEGDFIEKSKKQSKLKRKREVDQDKFRAFKKITKEGSHDLVKNCYSDHDVTGKAVPNMANGLSTKAIAKNLQKHNNISFSKELKCEKRGSLPASSKRSKNEVQDLSNAEVKAQFNASDLEKSERLNFAARKRKSKEWQDIQRNHEANASLNEVLSENEILKSKNARVSKTDGMGFSTGKVDGRMNRKVSSKRAILPSGGEQLPDGMDKEGRYAVGKEHQLGHGQGPATSLQALDCIDPLKNARANAQASAAATSSSSKVSSSRKSKANFQELKGSPVESVSSSPLRISNTVKLVNKRKSVVKDGATNVGSSVLGSPKRCSDSEVDGESDRSGKLTKDTAYAVQQQYIESHRAVEFGVLDSVRGSFNHQSKEANQLSGGKAEDEMHLKRGPHYDVSLTEFEEINVVSGTRNLMDQHSKYLHESPYKDYTQDLDNLNKAHQVNGSSQKNSGKNSSLWFRKRHRTFRSDMDQAKPKVSDSFYGNKDSYFTNNSSRYRQKVNLDSHQHSAYLEDLRDGNYNVQGKDEKDCLGKKDPIARSSIGRREDHFTFGLQENLDNYGSSILPNKHKDLDSRAVVLGARCGKSTIHDDLQFVSSCNDEKSPTHSISNRIDCPELPSGVRKTHWVFSSGDKQETYCRGPQKVPSPVQGSRLEVPFNDAVNADASEAGKQSRQPDIQNGMRHTSLRQATPNGPDMPSLIQKDGHSAAYIAMKEAKDLKHTASCLKSEGLELESTSLFFQAALKFLHYASLMEPLNFDGAKQGDVSRSMQIYFDTAKLCEFCAHEYERCKKMAAAALAYKCVAVAYFKSAYYKYPSASKDQHELHAALQFLQPGESPSSSASDLDNLNNHGSLCKATSAGGVSSPHVAGNHVITACSHHHVVRLLSYTSDVNCAFEATRKSQTAIAAAGVSLEKDRVDDLSSVRKVLDSNFHNVEGLLQLVRLSMESVNC